MQNRPAGHRAFGSPISLSPQRKLRGTGGKLIARGEPNVGPPSATPNLAIYVARLCSPRMKQLRLGKRPKDSCPVFVGNCVNLRVAWKDQARRRKRSGRCHLAQLLEIALESPEA